jgi:hypothetical protein
MSPRTSFSDVIVIVYGSLMSGLGMQSSNNLHARSASRVALLNARRGFAKFSQPSDCFSMVLEPLQPQQPIAGRILAVDMPAGDGPEGVALVIQPNVLARLGDREGYSGGAVQRLRDEATRRGEDIATFLGWLLTEVSGDVPAFRHRLFKLVGYTSPHYVPHPVALDGSRFAMTFLAPGREGSGSERVVPVRVRTGNESLMTAVEAWRRKPNRTQLAYLLACLLGGVHGIFVGDILAPLAEDAGLSERLRTAILAEQRQELGRFLDMTGLDHAAYWQGFGPPTQCLRRGGLEPFLKARGQTVTRRT